MSDNKSRQQRHRNHKSTGEAGKKPNLVSGVQVHEVLCQKRRDPLLQRGPTGNRMGLDHYGRFGNRLA